MHPQMDVTTDGMLGGRLRIIQPKVGYRAGVDAALLAAACTAAPGSRVIEAGCGVGGALLAAAARRPYAHFVGIEIDPAAVAIGRANVVANDMVERVCVLQGDVAAPFTDLGQPAFDGAMANPPFFDDPGALRGPLPSKTRAWISREGLAAWIAFLTRAVREGGDVTLIHRADRLGDLLSLLSVKCGSIQVRPIHPFVDAPAKRVLVRAVKSGKGPFRLLPALVLHDRSGSKHTTQAENVLRGEASLDWFSDRAAQHGPTATIRG
jgi:tRNA1(Val) A37 N6-methylase TrmN6